MTRDDTLKRSPTLRHANQPCLFPVIVLVHWTPCRPLSFPFLYAGTVTPQPSPPLFTCSQKLSSLVNPENSARYAYQKTQILEAQAFGIRVGLKEWKVDNGHLPQQAQADRVVEIGITEELDFSTQDALALAAAGKGVEHIGKDETGECHGRVVLADQVVCIHFIAIDE